MLPPSRRAIAILLVALLLPLASAQSQSPTAPGVPSRPSQGTPVGNTNQTPQQLDCTAASTTNCLPDLLPSNPTAQATDERYPSTACTDFLNVGTAPTANPFHVRLDVDGAAIGEQQVTKTYQQGEGEHNICWTGLQLVAGHHTMIVTVDSENEVVESNERNNAMAYSFYVGPTPQVDLTISGFTVSPTEGEAKVNQIFVVNVTNIGTAPSNASSLNITDDNGPMAALPVPALTPGQMRQFAVVTRPEFRPVGTFVAHAVIDALNENPEISKLNNDAYLQYTVLDHPAPDYKITNVTLTGNFTEFHAIRARVTVENIGDQFVRDNFVQAFNETGGIVGQGAAIGMLYPNMSSVVEFNLVLHAGAREIRFTADPAQRIHEKNETNNDWISDIVIAKPAADISGPNLVVERVYAMPASPQPGETVSVGALIHNVGTNRSAATTINFTADGKPIGSAQVPLLAVNNSYSAYIPWTPLASGTYKIAAAADPRDTIHELDESDNDLAFEFLVANETPPADDSNNETGIVAGPVNVTSPTPVVPTTPTPKPTTKPTNTTPAKLAFGELIVSTRSVPGGAKGIFSASIRNPSIQPVGQVSVNFKIDGKSVKTVLVSGIRGAATTAATTGEIDIPDGNHTVSAEVHVAGTADAPITRDRTYDVLPGKKSALPGFEVPALVAVLSILVLLRRRRGR